MPITETTISFERGSLMDEFLLELHYQLLTPRLVEEKMLKLLRQGRISKWFSGIGQEAICVGATLALQPNEYIFTLHRNLGVFTSRRVPLERLFGQWQGKVGGFTKGRDRSFHFGTMEHHIVGMISHLGPQLALADGVALAHKLNGEQKVALAFTGDGATSEGDFHEALNVAAVWQLPVIFLIENNGYGLSTPVNEQYRCEKLADRGVGYGMKALTIDGNNVLEVYQTIKGLAEDMRSNPQPVLLECQTFRMRGHEEASGTKYVPDELMKEWGRRDPIKNYQTYLLDLGILDEKTILNLEAEIKGRIESILKVAFADASPKPQLDVELKDVYQPLAQQHEAPPAPGARELRFVDAIAEGLDQAMTLHPKLILMGQDIAEYGGVFKITQGLSEKYGLDRVRNTPLCESAIVGTGLGLSLEGYKAMIEMQFADFVTCGFNQIVNNLAKLHYRWGQHADLVIRMPTGAGVGAGPFHSQSNEAWFFHTPGLKIAYPSNAFDAKGLLMQAFEDPNPILFFEHKALYRSVSGPVPEHPYHLPFGHAALVQSGTDLSIITYGMGVHWALKVTAEKGIAADILDLRTLSPLDFDAIAKSVQKTNRALILHEDTLTGGIGGELAAWIGEHLFEYLDAPVKRLGALDTPVPFAADLEAQFLPLSRLPKAIEDLLNY